MKHTEKCLRQWKDSLKVKKAVVLTVYKTKKDE